MGIAAGLFFSNADPKNTLDWRIRPSDDQYELQKERWNDLAGHLASDLRDKSGYPIRSWLQGSYKFGTQVRPANKDQEFDIDLGIYFEWDGEPEEGDYSAAELKSFVRDSLISYADEEGNDAGEVADPKPRCERLHFAPDFHIDVPCYHLRPSQDRRRLATQADDWESSDPKAIYRWWKDSYDDASLPRLRRLVRYLKMWAMLGFEDEGRPSSILLTVLVGDAWNGLGHDGLSGDDEYLTATVRAIVSRLDGGTFVPNPADNAENLNRLDDAQMDACLQRLRALLDVGERALKAVTKTEAADIWAEAFDHFFPLPDDAEEETAALKEASRALVPVVFDPRIAIEARPKHGDRVFRGINVLPPIPKNCSIRFVLTNADRLPAGAQLRWIVRNKGDEAEDQNDLGHISGTGAEVFETSEYRGTHYMDLSVRLGGTVIGRRRVEVKIVGISMPVRNPGRPAWTKLRRQ